jgi:hypothetical protein
MKGLCEFDLINILSLFVGVIYIMPANVCSVNALRPHAPNNYTHISNSNATSSKSSQIKPPRYADNPPKSPNFNPFVFSVPSKIGIQDMILVLETTIV